MNPLSIHPDERAPVGLALSAVQRSFDRFKRWGEPTAKQWRAGGATAPVNPIRLARCLARPYLPAVRENLFSLMRSIEADTSLENPSLVVDVDLDHLDEHRLRLRVAICDSQTDQVLSDGELGWTGLVLEPPSAH